MSEGERVEGMAEPVNASEPSRVSRLFAYLQLLRLPMVFTAIADVTMGYLFVQGSLDAFQPFLFLLGASCFLYCSGMVLNDVYDIDQDRMERPERPLPSGRIAVGFARWLGYELLVVGVILGWCAGLVWMGKTPYPFRAGMVASVLAMSVLLYDIVLKRTWLAPCFMGLCRFWNVLLGMSVAGHEVANAEGWQGLSSEQLWVAAGIGTYIMGVTWFARTEAVESRRTMLGFGALLIATGLGLLACFPSFDPLAREWRLEPQTVWPALLFLLGFSIIRRCLAAIADPRPQRGQQAIRHCLLSLIMLDASIVLLTCDWYWAAGVISLLAPTLLLGRWVYAT